MSKRQCVTKTQSSLVYADVDVWFDRGGVTHDRDNRPSIRAVKSESNVDPFPSFLRTITKL